MISDIKWCITKVSILRVPNHDAAIPPKGRNSKPQLIHHIRIWSGLCPQLPRLPRIDWRYITNKYITFCYFLQHSFLNGFRAILSARIRINRNLYPKFFLKLLIVIRKRLPNIIDILFFRSVWHPWIENNEIFFHPINLRQSITLNSESLTLIQLQLCLRATSVTYPWTMNHESRTWIHPSYIIPQTSDFSPQTNPPTLILTSIHLFARKDTTCHPIKQVKTSQKKHFP